MREAQVVSQHNSLSLHYQNFVAKATEKSTRRVGHVVCLCGPHARFVERLLKGSDEDYHDGFEIHIWRCSDGDMATCLSVMLQALIDVGKLELAYCRIKVRDVSVQENSPGA